MVRAMMSAPRVRGWTWRGTGSQRWSAIGPALAGGGASTGAVRLDGITCPRTTAEGLDQPEHRNRPPGIA
jgi:hypothetical protein